MEDIRLNIPIVVIEPWAEKRQKQTDYVTAHTDYVSALTLLPDGRLTSGSRDKTIKVWNCSTWKCEATLLGHTSYVMALAVLQDGRLASGSWDKTIKVWNLHSNGECEATFSGHTDYVMTLVVLPDGRLASLLIGRSKCGTFRTEGVMRRSWVIKILLRPLRCYRTAVWRAGHVIMRSRFGTF